eukprot:UN13246
MMLELLPVRLSIGTQLRLDIHTSYLPSSSD